MAGLPVPPVIVVRAENLAHGSDQQGCSPGRPAVMITIMCLRFVFLLITRGAAGFAAVPA
jgi:hypothetical protein